MTPMTDTFAPTDGRHQLLSKTLVELRPRLHRYAARMTGSTIDGDDVVQDTMLKVLESPPSIDNFSTLERWLLRVTHNAAIDFLRRRNRQDSRHSSEDVDMIVDPSGTEDTGTAALASLRTFMRLPALQRSTVIFKDVLGYSLAEIVNITESSMPAVKSALQRGRSRLKEFAQEPDGAPQPELQGHERSLLEAYAEHFNAQEFDTVRAMLADEVRLNLVNRLQANGKVPVSNYFSNYSLLGGWRMSVGMVDGRPALLAFDPDDALGTPMYFVLIEWVEGKVAAIRDFRYARYAMEGAEVRIVDRP